MMRLIEVASGQVGEDGVRRRGSFDGSAFAYAADVLQTRVLQN